MELTYDDYLEHYGVKGMKWGVRKSDKERSAKRTAKKEARQEKTTNRYLKKADASTKVADQFREQAEKSRFSYFKKGHLKDAAKYDKEAEFYRSEAELAKSGKMTKTQKRVVIGAAVVGTLVASKIAYDTYQSGEFNRIMTKVKNRNNPMSDLNPFKTNDKFSNKSLDADGIMRDVVSGINPDYGSKGTVMNCRRCTFAYELRRRGYDVSATKTANAHGQNVLGLLNATDPKRKQMGTGKMAIASEMIRAATEGRTPAFEEYVAGGGGKTSIFQMANPTKDSDKGLRSRYIFDRLSNEPNGSRGELSLIWNSVVPGIPGGGHSVAYEVIKGKPHIFDTQTGKEYKRDDPIFDNAGQAGYTRLDNVNLNYDYLMRWVK